LKACADISLFFGLALGAAFIYVGTQIRGRERAQPLLIASATTAIFFFGRFWASPVKEIFPSGILAALWFASSLKDPSDPSGLGVYKYGTIVLG
jgi:hypothetical protein